MLILTTSGHAALRWFLERSGLRKIGNGCGGGCGCIVGYVTSAGEREQNASFMLSVLKVAGIALIYSALGYMLFRTVSECVPEVLARWNQGTLDMWRLFDRYYEIFLPLTTALIAFFAGRSYRPLFQAGGVAAGAGAALLFRLCERVQWTRPMSANYTFFEAAFVGVIFGLLGSVSGRTGPKAAKPKTA